MSYRELRNFIEIMRCIGYSRIISIESFRNPNFELVADILLWLAERYDPNLDIDDDIETE
jgi:clusterin-associated protein 1